MTKHTSLFLVSLSSLKRARPTFYIHIKLIAAAQWILMMTSCTKAFQCHEPGTLTSCI